ncbi:MAG: hypothetical protein HS113_00850 [Verrucomicrobiales bacterium]|nr:hypothetical protein [Verrucomicrobiales bacterium]
MKASLNPKSRLLTLALLVTGLACSAWAESKNKLDARVRDLTDNTPVLVYSDTRGVFGGAALETGGLFPDGGDNKNYYGEEFTMSEILVGGKVEPTEAATLLAQKIEHYAKPQAK